MHHYVIRAFSDVEKPFLFSYFKSAKKKITKDFSTSEKDRVSMLHNVPMGIWCQNDVE